MNGCPNISLIALRYTQNDLPKEAETEAVLMGIIEWILDKKNRGKELKWEEDGPGTDLIAEAFTLGRNSHIAEVEMINRKKPRPKPKPRPY